MSFIVNVLNRGLNQAYNNTFGGKISCAIGRWLASRNRNVVIGGKTNISPAALINPRGSSIKIGDECKIAACAHIQGNVEIGDNSTVQSFSILVGYDRGRVSIGNGVRIAAQCMLIAGNHSFERIDVPIHRQGVSGDPIIIEDDVWIAGGVKITAGVRVGKGTVIGAGAVVTKDIPPMSIAVGVPAKVVSKRA